MPIASNKGTPLGIGDGADPAAVPQRLAVAVEYDAEDVRTARKAFEFAQRDRSGAGNLAARPLVAPTAFTSATMTT
ncbi:hypothetical protein [Candidatus Poriferisodalis sp.]|uniref:hypothetical protein n=1 Tax=Candidatus Poriferisodalis sp. TaxID=3101277 RepID=UPI003D0A1932